MGEEGDRKERKPVVGFGQRDIVFVRVKRVDERGRRTSRSMRNCGRK